MNNLRTNFNGYKISNNMISKNWLVGFVEGDGSFYFSHSSASFNITQKDKQILEAISIFIKEIELKPTYTNLVIPNKPNCIIKKNNLAYQLVITDVDVLFQYLYPFFEKLSFYSRKKIEFKTWNLGLYLIVYGYYVTSKGKILLLKLSNNMNSKRYFLNFTDFIDIKEIEILFNIDPPFYIHTGKSHFLLSKEYVIKLGSIKGFKVHIYKNDIEITGSPFSSFILGGKAIGLDSVGSIGNYIDTNKIFKGEYTFYSSPIISKNLTSKDKK